MRTLEVERRMAERVLVDGGFVISLEIPTCAEPITGIVQDVSEQGLRVIVPRYLPIGTTVTIFVHGRQEKLEVVRRQRTSKKATSYSCALMAKNPKVDLSGLMGRQSAGF